jgi:succinate dehydrogenase/fumarate reductase flavoprotein subunit
MPNAGRTGVFLPVELAMGMEKEMAEGRGPIFNAPPPADRRGDMHQGLPKLTEWTQRMNEKEKRLGVLPDSQRAIAVPLHGETSCIKVDQDMQTSLEGLWAIGDTSYAGSAVAGAVASPPGVTPGSGIMYALISAAWAGTSTARYAGENAKTEIDIDEIKQLKEDIFAPMQAKKQVAPTEAISTLQDMVAPFRYNLRRSKDRLEEALKKVESVKEKLPELKAKDLHYLSKCHEVKSMTLCAELTFKAALLRTESRGFHYREDYPVRNDKEWLKWIILQQDKDQVKLYTQPIPIGGYKIKPGP